MRLPACFLFMIGLISPSFAQPDFKPPSSNSPASPSWPFGPPRTRETFKGNLARSDGETMSIELPDQRVVRFKLDDKTRYSPEAPPANESAFNVTDFVAVESEVDTKGYLLARSVRFLRKGSPEEQAEIFRCPEIRHRWSRNLLSATGMDESSDDRRLSVTAKPKAIVDSGEGEMPVSAGSDDQLIALIRRRVNEAFERLPSLRAKLVTSLFHSTSKPLKWIPEGVIAADVEFEENREAYLNVRIDGKRPLSAPDTGETDYILSLDKAWSTGDFETIARCVFEELEDADFRRVRPKHSQPENTAVYEFTGGRGSSCIGVKYRSQLVYPAFKGVLKANAETGEVLHVQLEAAEIPKGFPLDRAERSVDFGAVRIGEEEYLLPTTAYWFGCFRSSYSCFLNRIDFRDYRRFSSDSIVRFGH